MRIEKDKVVAMLRSQGEHDKAQQAGCALPRQVDTDQDAGVLHGFDISICDLTRAMVVEPGATGNAFTD